MKISKVILLHLVAGIVDGAKDCVKSSSAIASSSAIVSSAAIVSSISDLIIPTAFPGTNDSGIDLGGGSPNGPDSAARTGRVGLPTLTASSRSRYSGNNTSNCPAYTPAPVTQTKVLTRVYSYSTTLTTPLTLPVFVEKNVSTISTHYTQTAFGTTIVLTFSPFTRTVISVSPAQTSVTVPRPADFTPIKCQPEYYQSTVTVTTNETVLNDVTTSYSAVTASNWTVTATRYIYTATTTSITTGTQFTYSQQTGTVTLTRNDPTSTVYEACSTDNVVADRAYGGYFDSIFPVLSANHSAVTYTVRVPTLGAVDCCGLCQANSTCVGSTYSSYDSDHCQLFFRTDSGTCDPYFSGLIALAPTTNEANWVSNGACGQLTYADYGPYV